MYDENGALSGKVMPDAINSTINATAPPSVPTPERGPVTSSRERTIMHPFWAWSPLCPLNRKLDVISPAWLQKCQLLPSRKEGHISTCKTVYWMCDPGVASDDFI